jgi:hypothetical protein
MESNIGYVDYSLPLFEIEVGYQAIQSDTSNLYQDICPKYD